MAPWRGQGVKGAAGVLETATCFGPIRDVSAGPHGSAVKQRRVLNTYRLAVFFQHKFG